MTKAKWRSLGKHETRRFTGRCPRTAPFCPPPPTLPGGPVGSAWCGGRCRPLSTEARDSPRPRAPVEPGHSQRGEQEARWQRRAPLGDSAGGHHLSSALLVALCPASAEGCRAVLAGFQSACCPGLGTARGTALPPAWPLGPEAAGGGAGELTGLLARGHPRRFRGGLSLPSGHSLDGVLRCKHLHVDGVQLTCVSSGCSGPWGPASEPVP